MRLWKGSFVAMLLVALLVTMVQPASAADPPSSGSWKGESGNLILSGNGATLTYCGSQGCSGPVRMTFGNSFCNDGEDFAATCPKVQTLLGSVTANASGFPTYGVGDTVLLNILPDNAVFLIFVGQYGSVDVTEYFV
jgi:hypothetical protein